MRRREFLAARPPHGRTPRASSSRGRLPTIGFLGVSTSSAWTHWTAAFVRRLPGLKDAGYVEGENVAILYRYAENQMDRLPELAAELVRRQVAVIAAVHGPPAAFAAKAATTTIPIVFTVSEDPVRTGLVASLAYRRGIKCSASVGDWACSFGSACDALSCLQC